MSTRWLAVLALAVACGGRQTEVEHAKRARYDAELPVLLAETAEVVRQWYGTIEIDPQGTIRTPWHQIERPRDDDSYGTPTTAARNATWRKEFVRFHIVISGRPSRIDVTCHAAYMMRDRMAVPEEYPPEKEPHWTSAFADTLRLKIHAKLERFAR